ncbi:putative mitochondrial carrier protein [Trypanosoma grayi]|uniref:putative mitochondrial carrier protein n=1 Tax=Trypanosoma grayi TaxID=71804 RepID=UPI0004F4307A|nr:putative mitochondrial carrier protein [Trypanosoma grayi]KEG05673.1 putative mitochondrial carrier protein [Trypanosoma grayi]
MMDVLCAAMAGMMARLVCHPLDTTKTVAFTGFCGEHRVTNARPRAASSSAFFSSICSIWQREGVAGFYRGIGVATLGSAPGVALYLTTYTWASDFLQHQCQKREAQFVDTGSAVPSWSIYLLCGLFAETVSCAFWVPIDVTKERLQSQPPSQPGRYTGSWDALRTVTRYEGLRGLYKGYGSTLASFGPYSAVYFAFYEFLNDIFSNRLSFGAFTAALYAGGLANIAASIVTNPLEYVKTRLQVQRVVLLIDGKPTTVEGFNYRYTGLVDGLCAVVREEGPRALWRGVGSRTAYAAPNAALTMAFYKYLQLRCAQDAATNSPQSRQD